MVFKPSIFFSEIPLFGCRKNMYLIKYEGDHHANISIIINLVCTTVHWKMENQYLVCFYCLLKCVIIFKMTACILWTIPTFPSIFIISSSHLILQNLCRYHHQTYFLPYRLISFLQEHPDIFHFHLQSVLVYLKVDPRFNVHKLHD